MNRFSGGVAMKTIVFSVVIIGLLLIATPVVGHHAFMSEFDLNKPVTLRGVITKIEWVNPHALFYMDVTDEKGALKTWTLESACPNALKRRGWTRTSFKPRDSVVVVEGYRAKNGAALAATRTVTLANGLKVSADSDGIRP
jgi:hypothetical protein